MYNPRINPPRAQAPAQNRDRSRSPVRRPQVDLSQVECLSNFVKLEPIRPDEQINQYRVDFEPPIESVSLRRKLFRRATEKVFITAVVYDGMSDARSSTLLQYEESNFTVNHPDDESVVLAIKVKRVGSVNPCGLEMLRIYNMNMKTFFRKLKFFQVSQTGAYVHPSLITPIGNNNSIVTVRGFRTAANVHEGNHILMNLESVHKLMQKKNVLQNMVEIRGECRDGNIQEAVKAALVGKLVVTNYNKMIYKIEDVNFKLNPQSTFPDFKTKQDISYLSYFKNRYNVSITDQRQPLLLVVPNNKRKRAEEEKEHDIYVVPELCNIAGLTEAQRNDNRLKVDLIKSSQIPPTERVKHMDKFLELLHSNDDVKEILAKWGYNYGKQGVKVNAHVMKPEVIGVGRSASEPAAKWPKVAPDGGFEREVMRESLAVSPELAKLTIIISRRDAANEKAVVGKIRNGFDKIGLKVGAVDWKRIDQDSSHAYVQAIRGLPPDTTATLVIMPGQNKDKYDAIKKLASVERGLVTQVITSRLMMDDRKSGGASVKIGVQIAAKVGGEPWHINLPLKSAMVCGYDTYHDSAQRGRSFGAFTASMNDKFSKWFSKADSHDTIEELSSNMSENLSLAIKGYHRKNNRFPERIFIYRDGVSDGQLDHVNKVELKQVQTTISAIDSKIRLTFIVVNKRVGARFYLRQSNSFVNPTPGTVIDEIVTRKDRLDFYLISQSTRFGTVAPTYYNIILDESNLGPDKLQAMAFKLCLMYFNWTGTVRVPAPCQYAHKLALLCGEHLHAVPNSNLDDRLHFL